MKSCPFFNRNPLLLFGIIPLVLFLILQSFPSQGAKKRERLSVIFTNAAIAAIITVMSLTFPKLHVDSVAGHHYGRKRRYMVVQRSAPVRGCLLDGA